MRQPRPVPRSDRKRKERVFARPVPGRTVPLEDGRPWPAEGAAVELTRYVRRRLADGDVVETPRPAKPKKAAEAKPADAKPAAAPKDGKASG